MSSLALVPASSKVCRKRGIQSSRRKSSASQKVSTVEFGQQWYASDFFQTIIIIERKDNEKEVEGKEGAGYKL